MSSKLENLRQKKINLFKKMERAQNNYKKCIQEIQIEEIEELSKRLKDSGKTFEEAMLLLENSSKKSSEVVKEEEENVSNI